MVGAPFNGTCVFILGVEPEPFELGEHLVEASGEFV